MRAFGGRDGLLSAAAIAALVLAPASCSSSPPAPPQPVDEAEAAVLFGDDRVADVLRADLGKVPRTLSEFERVFGVGRACARSDSKEIYVIEETSSRFGGVQKRMPVLAPRLAITGCNPDLSAPGGELRSGGLLVAVVSSEEAPRFAQGDTLMTGPVEAMALDRKSGLYSFYVVGEEGGVARLELGADGKVKRHTKKPGRPLETVTLPGAQCFHCHVHGGPIMNELADPWTAWVSPRRPAVFSAGLSGETAELVAEATGTAGAHTRTGYAGGLEVTVRWAIDQLASAHVRATLEGARAGGVGGLLRSVFCETELQYTTNNGDTVPIETVLDPAVFDRERFDRPRAVSGVTGPVHLPVRGEMDKAIERELVQRGYLTRELALAARLLDPEADVFSAARCAVHASLALPPGATPEVTAAHVRERLAEAASPVAAGPRRAYLDALLDAASASRDAARAAWLDEARSALARATARLATDAGRADVDRILLRRQAAARELFPRDENPLPVFDVPPAR